MKRFVVANNKGGVGKTTVSKLVSEYCASLGKRVLAIDLDSQCSLSHRYLDMDLGPRDKKDWIPPVHPDYKAGEIEGWNGRSSTADIFLKGFAVPYPTGIENLEIIPGHSHDLNQVERVRQNEVYNEVLKIFDDWLSMDENEMDYDICIIDTGPSKGPNTSAAIHASTHMLIPVEMEQQSIEGLYGMIALRTHENLTRDNQSRLELVGILPNKFKVQRKRQNEFLDALKKDPKAGEFLLPSPLHDWTGYADDAVPESEGGMPLFSRPPSDRVRKEFEEIAGTIVERIFK
jgi:chromosome partitioning protein